MNTFIIIMKIVGLIFLTRTRKGDRKHKEGGYVRLQEMFSVHVRVEEEQWWVRSTREYSLLFSARPEGTVFWCPTHLLFFFLRNSRSFIYLFIYLWLCWVFVSVRGLSLVASSWGHSSSRCAGLSLSRPLLLRSTGSRRAGSVVVAHGPSCSAACGIFPDQGSNPCPLHWQVDSQPLRHQGSPVFAFLSDRCSQHSCIYLIQTW